MKLKALVLENFRCYKDRIRIGVGNLTAFVGKNDVGKSSVLEALEIFFNSEQVKLTPEDRCVYSDNDKVRIGCVFTHFPDEIAIDATAKTTLKEEYLLNADGELEIHKAFDCSVKNPKEAIFAIANHPTGEDIEKLLLMKQNDLKGLLKKLEIDEKDVDLRSNVQIRRAIRLKKEPLVLSSKEIALDKEDARKIWEQLKPHLPLFALFRSDRPSQDGDEEVQNPLRFAVVEAIRQVEREILQIENTVRAKTKEVAERTLNKLKEMNPDLAAELKPDFKSDRKWDSLFKFTLNSDDNIPINKRGSGIRRLILLNFFRAEAERRQIEKEAPRVIYAIEEPETSQHPSNQHMLVEAFKVLAEQENTQLVLTTHTPAFAGLLPTSSLRYICRNDDKITSMYEGSDDILRKIAEELGVLTDKRVQVLLHVEGPNDVSSLHKLSAILSHYDSTIISLCSEPRIAMIPIGGSNLRQWVENHYLKGLGLPEVHIYDRDNHSPPKYKDVCDKVNARKDGSWAVLTRKREIENYLHPGVIQETLGILVSFTADDDVPLIVARALHEADPDSKPWEELTNDRIKDKVKNVKRRLNREVAARMTLELLKESDPDGEIEEWLKKLGSMLK